MLWLLKIVLDLFETIFLYHDLFFKFVKFL